MQISIWMREKNIYCITISSSILYAQPQNYDWSIRACLVDQEENELADHLFIKY